jgi:hypothetical protein
VGFCSTAQDAWKAFDSIHHQRPSEFAEGTSFLWDLVPSLPGWFPIGLLDLLASVAKCHAFDSDRAPVAGSTKAKPWTVDLASNSAPAARECFAEVLFQTLYEGKIQKTQLPIRLRKRKVE